MLKLTFPIVKSTLVKSKLSIFALIILSVLLGVVPTLKSELESGIINQIDKFSRGTISSTSLSDAIHEPLERFSEISKEKEADLSQRAVYFILSLFVNIPLIAGVAVYLVIALLSYIIEIMNSTVKTGISRNIFVELRGEGLRKGLRADPSNLPSLPNVPGQYATAIHQGATNITTTYGYILEAGQYLFALTTILIIVYTKSMAFALCCLVLVVAQVVISIIQARNLGKRRRDLDRKRNDLVARTDEILTKREIIVAYDQQQKFEHRLDTLSLDYASVDRRLDIWEQVYGGGSQFVSDFGRIAVLCLGLVIIILTNKSGLSNIGDAYFMLSIYTRMFVPVANLLMRYDSIKRSEATSKTYLDILSYEPPQVKSSPENVSETAKPSKNVIIQFDNVSFSYGKSDSAPLILSNSSFVVPKNSTTLILGRSGCGKSTIARILLGFWAIKKGHVMLDGRNLNEYTPEELRLKMSYVSQTDHFVDDTIQENLSWGQTKAEITETRMLETLRSVDIINMSDDASILRLPAKNLSLGQQQRLSVARMLLDESDIVIVDEPLAGVDVFTFREMLPMLKEVFTRHNRTFIMFSHRLSFAAYANHVIVLGEQGKVQEHGSPLELLAKVNGVFRQLVNAAKSEIDV